MILKSINPRLVCAVYEFVEQPFCCMLFVPVLSNVCSTYDNVAFCRFLFFSVAGTSLFQSDKSIFDAHRSSILISNYLFIQIIDSSIAN